MWMQETGGQQRWRGSRNRIVEDYSVFVFFVIVFGAVSESSEP